MNNARKGINKMVKGGRENLNKMVKKGGQSLNSAVNKKGNEFGRIVKEGGKSFDRIMGKERNDYICHICNKESRNAVDAMTHMLDHATSALESISDMIKDQEMGNVSHEKEKRHR